MKVLLFSNDLMPYGELPTSGGGLRCYQLAEGLRYHGIEVVISMPGFTYLAEKNFSQIPDELREHLWSFDTQDEICRRVKPDAVLFASNWDHFNLAAKPDVPLIIDLHGSRLIETKMWDAPVSTERKVSIFSKADCLLSAGKRQRLYFYGWLLQAGRVPDDEHFIRYIPVSLSPDLPSHAPMAEEPSFVTGGGWFPWQNQSRAIFAICRAIAERNRGHIELYGTPHNKIASSPEEARILEIYEQIKALAQANERIRVCGYVGRNELVNLYRSRSIAVELMEYNLERELAFTTRTIEYLWCGLPVLYNNFGEISDHIREYDAGWAIDPEDDRAINDVIQSIYDSPAALEQKSQNAQRLVRERFAWDRTTLPLVDFLRNPRRYPETRPVLGSAYARPAFLNARGHAVDVPLLPNRRFVQQFVLPADHIAAVELPYVLTSAEGKDSVKSVGFEIHDACGRRLCKKDISGSALEHSGRFVVSFPFFSEPKGGTELRLSVQLRAAANNHDSGRPCVLLRGLVDAGYPLFASGSNSALNHAGFAAQTVSGQPSEAEVLALSFIPSEFNRIYHLKVKFGRACRMLRQGEWRHVLRAMKRRMPKVLRILAASGRVAH